MLLVTTAIGNISLGKYTFLTIFPFAIIVNAACDTVVVKNVHGISPVHKNTTYGCGPSFKINGNITAYTANCNNGFKKDHKIPKNEFLYLPLISFFYICF